MTKLLLCKGLQRFEKLLYGMMYKESDASS